MWTEWEDEEVGEAGAEKPRAGGDILVVDDTIANLKLLAGMLRSEGYTVRPVPSGAQALRAAARRPPDLVLLDISMPEMDGYEVCGRLKADPILQGVPVIFISALSELDDKVKAFAKGGVDYITKPFQLDEVRARVETHLRLRRLQRQVEARNAELASTNAALEQMQCHRDELMSLIVHDLRAPLSGMLLSLGMLQEDLSDRLDAQGLEDIEEISAGARLLSVMITDLLDIRRLEAGELPLAVERHLTAGLIESTLRGLGGLVRERSVTVRSEPGLTLMCDAEVLRRVLSNLVDNAIKHTHRSVPIELTAHRSGSSVRFAVRDHGPGIAPEHLELIFERFRQVEARKKGRRASTGLGLTFCKLAVEAHDGCIGVDSILGKETTFWFELPAHGPGQAQKPAGRG